MTRDDIQRWLTQFDDEATLTLADGFEDAFLGSGERCSQPPVAVYDVDKCIDILMTRDGMTYEEAWETFSFNTLGAWVGPATPLFLTRYEPEEEQ